MKMLLALGTAMLLIACGAEHKPPTGYRFTNCRVTQSAPGGIASCACEKATEVAFDARTGVRTIACR
jgi:hypothetical protein